MYLFVIYIYNPNNEKLSISKRFYTKNLMWIYLKSHKIFGKFSSSFGCKHLNCERFYLGSNFIR